jgi:hypothetical protein
MNLFRSVGMLIKARIDICIHHMNFVHDCIRPHPRFVNVFTSTCSRVSPETSPHPSQTPGQALSDHYQIKHTTHQQSGISCNLISLL